MSMTQTAPLPDPDYWKQVASKQLCQLKPDSGFSSSLERKLWDRLLTLQAAANAVLDDVDDDGVAEAHDVAVLGLRNAVSGHQKPTETKVRTKRVITTQPITSRSIGAK